MTGLHASRPSAEAAAERLRVFAQPQRLMILSLLLTGEHTVGEIEDATGVTQPALSQQLAELRRAELVAARREAKKVYYRLAGDQARRCVQTIAALFGDGRPPGSWPEAAEAAAGQPVQPPLARPTAAASFAIVDEARQRLP